MNNKDTIKINNEEIWNLLKLTYGVPKEFKYQVVQLSGNFVARPDLLSISMYGVSTYADVLCKLNGISNPFEMNEGMYLIIPDPSVISEFYSNESFNDTLVTEDDTVDATSIINLQKKKNEARKANEQIIGDSNFRIDKNNKIVIY